MLRLVQRARAEAKLDLDTLDAKRDKYDTEVGAAEEIVSNLLNRAMYLTFNELNERSGLYKGLPKPEKNVMKRTRNGRVVLPFRTAMHNEQLAHAQEHLSIATSLLPLAPEANELLGIVMLQAGDGSSAIKAFDAVVSQGLPVAFYGELRGHKQDRPVKCELGKGGVEIVYLACYGKNAKPASHPQNQLARTGSAT